MNPSAQQWKVARAASGLSQTAAGALVFSKKRTVQDWEAGITPVHPGLFKLFCIETNQLPLWELFLVKTQQN